MSRHRPNRRVLAPIVRLSSNQVSAQRPRLIRYGVTLLALGMIAAVLTGCAAVTASNTPTPTTSSVNAIRDFNEAQALQGANHCDRAIPLYLKAVNEDNTYLNAYTALGSCYLNPLVGSPKGAIEEYNKAIQIDPENFNLYFLRGQAEYSIGMNGAAQKDCTTAMQLAPAVVDTYQSLANNCFGPFADFPGQIAATNKAIALSPGSPSLYEARGNIYLSAKQYDKAYQDYVTAIGKAPFGPARASIDAGLANAYAGNLDYDHAFTYIHDAITLQPDNVQFYIQSAGIHNSAGHYMAAIGLYDQALSHAVRYADIETVHEGKGNVYSNLNDYTKAIAEYKQALNFTKDKDTRARLQSSIKSARQPTT